MIGIMETSGGNLVALCCIGHYKKNSSSSMSMIRDLHTNVVNLLERHSDMYSIDGIRIQNKYDIASLNTIELIFAGDINEEIFQYNGFTYVKKDKFVQSVPFSLIKKLAIIDVDEEYTTIHIPMSLFFKFTNQNIEQQSIPQIALCQHTVNINVTSSNDMTYDIIGKYTYLDTKPRGILAQERSEYINTIVTMTEVTRDTSSHPLGSAELSVTHSVNPIKIPRDNILSGFFIEAEQLPTQMKIFMNAHPYWNYDKYMIKYISQKISSNDASESHKCMYWIPIEYGEKWDSQVFKSTIDLSRIDKCEITFDPSFTGTVYFVTHSEMIIERNRMSISRYRTPMN